MNKSEALQWRKFVEKYREDIVAFSIDILKITPDEEQIKILNGFKENNKISIKAGRGVGKTIALGIAASWFISLYDQAKIIVLANTSKQSKSVVWATLVPIIQNSLLGSFFEITNEQIYFKGDPNRAFILRLVADDQRPESAAGYHSPNMCYLVDEASGINDQILITLVASLTESNNKVMMTSNPTRSAGYFYESFNKPDWHNITIDARNSKWSSQDFCREMIEEYGIDSDIVRVQVLGEFPLQSTSLIISNETINSWRKYEYLITQSDSTVLSLDISAGGDDMSVWVIRKGRKIIEIKQLNTNSIDQLLHHTNLLYEKYNPDKIIYDATGVGALLSDLFRKQFTKSKIIPINFAEKSLDDRAKNMRTYIYLRLQDFGDLDCSSIRENDWKNLAEELKATEYTMGDVDFKFHLIPKKQIKLTIGRSPDIADALALSFAYRGDLIKKDILERSTVEPDEMLRGLLQAAKW